MKLFALSFLAALGLAVGAGQALAASHHHLTAKSTLTVGMRDPGCHWFVVKGNYEKAASVAGPVRVKNMDEATLKVASRSGMQYIKVGKSLILPKGHYVVMMVGQAVDDNYLKLTVG